ncbi:MAG: DNA repair protein RecN [Eubacteriales bacterium]|nr:DNA repair protein RecN [Eubacteriales bacterium]
MLLSLHIENIAVIKNINIDFPVGFSALTGETGAGKSIIIDSINLLMGAKADRSLIRDGERRACVAGLFGEFSETVTRRITALGLTPDEEGKLLVYRAFDADGHSVIKINGQAVGISVLRDTAKLLIAVQGQNESQSLVSKNTHTELLDRYAHNEELLSEYSLHYSTLLSQRKQLSDMDKEAEEKDSLIDILKFQISEIENVKPKEGEEELLNSRLSKLINIEKIAKQSSFVYRALKGGEKANAIYIIDRCIASLETLSDIIPDSSELAEALSDCRQKLDDVAEDVHGYTDGIEGDPTQLIDKIQSRLESLSRLKRKYGDTATDILAFHAKAKEKLSMLQHSDERRQDLLSEIAETEKYLVDCAKRLSESRKKAAKQLEEKVCESLAFLDMPKVSFIASVTPRGNADGLTFDRYGADDVNFLISANAGMMPMPLDKIASGGELSRIMLSVKNVMAESDEIPTVIYDEIDAGVSGKTARKIGIMLKKCAAASQVICVTHSAQIASLANTHFLISKSNDDDIASTAVTELDRSGRIDELSRIIGGISVTDSQRMAAIDMMLGSDVEMTL